MQFLVLADEASWYFRDLQRAAEARGHACRRADFRALQGRVSCGGEAFALSPEPSPACDALVVRSMPAGTLEQVIFRMDVLGRWEANGLTVCNSPRSLECAIDKYLTTARLAAAGLPVPETHCCQTVDDALAAFAQLGGDVVVKPLFGAEGRGIVRLQDADVAWRVFQTLTRLGALLYLQRFIEHGGWDVRVLTLGDRVLGGMKRSSAEDFRTNISRQGTAACHRPTPEEVELALEASRAVGTTIAGVDILYDGTGSPFVIEVNGVPGWQAFGRVNELDVATELIAYLERA